MSRVAAIAARSKDCIAKRAEEIFDGGLVVLVSHTDSRGGGKAVALLAVVKAGDQEADDEDSNPP
jgi:hypothetical protein